MKDTGNPTDTMWYFTGGLAEIVSHPSPLTYSFVSDWFTGQKSIGTAMDLLHLPVRRITQSPLQMYKKNLAVYLPTEEATLYADTVFCYLPLHSTDETPHLTFAWKNALHPSSWRHTFSMTLTQSSWIRNPEDTYKQAESWVNHMPKTSSSNSILSLDSLLAHSVWPVVIAVGSLAEFYSHLASSDSITNLDVERDWFFQSIAQMSDVKSGSLSIEDFLKKYGNRADVDYELTCPRWYEIPEILAHRISKIPMRDAHRPRHVKQSAALTTAIRFQLLRSQAKKNALDILNLLRQALLKQTGTREIAHLTKQQILNHHVTPPSSMNQDSTDEEKPLHRLTQSRGYGVSNGLVRGKARIIYSPDEEIQEGTIGIFPNASPQFAIVYPKCRGMIFLSGGTTSHGSIVAREFAIPAIIDSHAAAIPDSASVEINGSLGSWKLL